MCRRTNGTDECSISWALHSIKSDALIIGLHSTLSYIADSQEFFYFKLLDPALTLSNKRRRKTRNAFCGICPIAPLALLLTLYSLTGSRVWHLWSRDVIGHVTIGTADGLFLLVVCWLQVTISHGWWEITRHNLDNHIPIVNSLETNFGGFWRWEIMPFFSNLSLAASERCNMNY